MRQALQLKFSQQLKMTPQLQQAIKLLQLSTLDLQQEIIEQLYNNPLLETDELESSRQNQEKNNADDSEDMDLNSDDPALYTKAQEASEPTTVESESAWDRDRNENLTVDGNWDNTSTTAPKSVPSDGEFNVDSIYQVTESLQDHLLWQLNLATLSERDREIAETLIDSINDSGLISENLKGITAHLDHLQQEPLQEDELVAVLKRLQQFDPPGVFARNVKECLLIQLNQLSPETPFVEEAKFLVEEFLQDIASTELNKLAKRTKLEKNTLQQAILLIKSLNPRPGELISSDKTEYIVPDAYVEKIDGSWRVRLNDSNIPRLRINEAYSHLIKRSDNSSENQFLKRNLYEARWFLRSLESRNETLMQVVMAIVKFQQGFLNHGPVAMKPLVLSDIADQLDLHESTVSRVTTKKYMATPQGIFELKYFFSSHVGTADGGECSSTAVCAMLKMLIAAEQPSKPLSDNKLTTLLSDQGIQVARRTVAKYRESMNIPSSSHRKRFENNA